MATRDFRWDRVQSYQPPEGERHSICEQPCGLLPDVLDASDRKQKASWVQEKSDGL